MAEDVSAPEFVVPQRQIKTLQSLAKWNTSKAYRDLTGIILTLNEAMKGKKLTDDCHTSKVVQDIVILLDTLSNWIDEIPACDQPQRFGNKSFQVWLKRVCDHSKDLIDPLLPEKYKGASVELRPYLHGSFGNGTRIDYGTGHEVCFLFFLCCLYKLRVIGDEDRVAIVCKIFVKYLDLTRKLQQTYRMEPAGSQGVWGLDDHQFVPYIWGSSQLIDHPSITPTDIPDSTKANQLCEDYMFFGCLKYINIVKTGPFAEHSNVLWGISNVQHWTKVNSGLIKMYKNEVLSKFPIIQHFEFGTLMSIEKACKDTV